MAKVNLSTIKNWFKTGLKPTQAQFWNTWDSFWHKDEAIPVSAVENLSNILSAKADATAMTNHISDENAHGFLAFKFMLFGTLDPSVINQNLDGYPSLYDWMNNLNNNSGIGLGVRIEREEFVFATNQTFTLSNNYLNVLSVEVQGQGALSQSQYTLIAPNQIQINDTLDSGDYVVVIYSGALQGSEDYYSKSQIDSLLSNYLSATALADYYTKIEVDGFINSVTDAIGNKEDSITPGTNAQYYRGDKTWQTLDKASVGLTSVDNTADIDKVVSNPQNLAIGSAQTAAQNYADALIVNIKNGVSIDGDTLKKLNDKILAINAIIGGTNPDVDTIVNTVAELLSVFQTYPEGLNLFFELQDKVSLTNVVNNLTTTATEKVLDARQGKVLKDLIDALTTSLTNKVDKVAGKGLSENDFTTTLLNKLNGLQANVWRARYDAVNFTTTTSTTYVPLISAVVGDIPANTRSLMVFTAEVLHSNNNKLITFALFVNGLILQHTQTTVNAHPIRSACVALNSIPILATGDTFSVRWFTESNTAQVVRGTLSITN